jgi:hypothetical protein
MPVYLPAENGDGAVSTSRRHQKVAGHKVADARTRAGEAQKVASQ